MKTIIITVTSLILAFASYSKEDQSLELVIGKILPKRDVEPRPDKDGIKPDLPGAKRFPPWWGHPPRIQVRDHVKLPGKFGFGSSTVAKWIIENLKKDGKDKPIIEPRPEPPVKPIRPPAVLKKIELLREKQKELFIAREELIEDLKGKSKKTAMLLVRDFKEANKQKHLDIKEAQKAIVEDIRSRKQTGARRSE
jgi:hypothetical protein